MKVAFRLSYALVGLLVLAFVPSSARADTTFWSSIAAGCHIDPSAESIAGVDPVNGIVYFSGNNTGTIKLACPVTKRDGTNPTTIQISYNENGSSNGSNCYVQAHLQRVTLSPSLSGATVQSVTSSDGTSYAASSVDFTHTLDFESNYYWVYIVIFRNTTSCSPWAYGARLYYRLV